MVAVAVAVAVVVAVAYRQAPLFSFGAAGTGAALLGKLADATSIEHVYSLTAYTLPGRVRGVPSQSARSARGGEGSCLPPPFWSRGTRPPETESELAHLRADE